MHCSERRDRSTARLRFREYHRRPSASACRTVLSWAGACAHHALAVPGKRHRVDKTAVALELLLLLPRLGIPDPDRAVPAPAHHALAVPGKTTGEPTTRCGPWSSCCCCPVSASQIRTVLSSAPAHHALAVPGKRHRGDQIYCGPDLLLLPRLGIPDPERVASSRSPRACRRCRENDTEVTALLWPELLLLLPRLGIPDPDRLVAAPAHHARAVPGKRHRGDPPLWPLSSCCCCPVSASQIRTVLSSLPLTTRLPSRENDTGKRLTGVVAPDTRLPSRENDTAVALELLLLLPRLGIPDPDRVVRSRSPRACRPGRTRPR